jgi:hypothetical protein
MKDVYSHPTSVTLPPVSGLAELPYRLGDVSIFNEEDQRLGPDGRLMYLVCSTVLSSAVFAPARLVLARSDPHPESSHLFHCL